LEKFIGVVDMTIQQINDSLYRVAIPVPFPMKYVYCYVFKEQNGWSIVDAGLNYGEAIEAWENVFATLGIIDDHVQSIVITHFHPDHFGLSGWLQQKTGAPVYMSKVDADMADRVWSEESKQAERVGAMCKENGVPADLSDEIESNMKRLGNLVLPLPEVSILTEDHIQLGGKRWDIIPVPGHSEGLFCLYQEEQKYLIAADHVLERITPNISVWPGCDQNPLQRYFDSLRQVQHIKAELTMPAHGGLIENLNGRVEEIILHHDKRLAEMEALVENGATTAYEVALSIFKHKKLNAHQWRFAIGETLAHLEYLVSKDRLTKKKSEQQYMYSQR
jgi:glyoxylase-like metal-dependent hydrolase (beta-lactamase superfamily II)